MGVFNLFFSSHIFIMSSKEKPDCTFHTWLRNCGQQICKFFASSSASVYQGASQSSSVPVVNIVFPPASPSRASLLPETSQAVPLLRLFLVTLCSWYKLYSLKQYPISLQLSLFLPSLLWSPFNVHISTNSLSKAIHAFVITSLKSSDATQFQSNPDTFGYHSRAPFLVPKSM